VLTSILKTTVQQDGSYYFSDQQMHSIQGVSNEFREYKNLLQENRRAGIYETSTDRTNN